MPRAPMPHTWRRTNVDLPIAGRPMTNMLGCSMMPARNQLIGSQHTPAPVVMLRPMGTPSTGSSTGRFAAFSISWLNPRAASEQGERI